MCLFWSAIELAIPTKKEKEKLSLVYSNKVFTSIVLWLSMNQKILSVVLCAGNLVCFRVIYSPAYPSISVAEPSNAGMLSGIFVKQTWCNILYISLFVSVWFSLVSDPLYLKPPLNVKSWLLTTIQVLPIDMMDFLDAPVPYIVSHHSLGSFILLSLNCCH